MSEIVCIAGVTFGLVVLCLFDLWPFDYGLHMHLVFHVSIFLNTVKKSVVRCLCCREDTLTPSIHSDSWIARPYRDLVTNRPAFPTSGTDRERPESRQQFFCPFHGKSFNVTDNVIPFQMSWLGSVYKCLLPSFVFCGRKPLERTRAMGQRTEWGDRDWVRGQSGTARGGL